MPRWAAGLFLAAFLLAVFVAGYGLAYTLANEQAVALRRYGDSVTTVAVSLQAEVTAAAQRLQDSSQVLHVRRVMVVGSADSIRARADAAERLLAVARTAGDSIPILLTQVADLRASNDSLRRAVTLAEAEAAVQQHRGDTLAVALGAQTRTIVDLNRQLQALAPRPPRLPGWARTGLKAAAAGAIFYAGTQFERHSGN